MPMQRVRFRAGSDADAHTRTRTGTHANAGAYRGEVQRRFGAAGLQRLLQGHLRVPGSVRNVVDY